MSDIVDNRSRLDTLVEQWWTLREAADALGVSPNRVRQLAREHQLIVMKRPGRPELELPADFIADGAVVKGLGGTLTLLDDHGFDDAGALVWLFTADDTLPGRPIDALRQDRGTEVRRRAQAID